MFELSIALKYLIPRKRQLSVSLIALLSVLVISLVVWLALIFLSVTEGMERNWLNKLTALNAPLRILPTDHYYNSYYYQIDAYSNASDFTYKNIGQKEGAPKSDPYAPLEDVELPPHFPQPERDAAGQLIDPVKRAYSVLEELSGVVYQDFELSGALMRLQLLRQRGEVNTQSFLTQVSYVASLPDRSPNFASMLLTDSLEVVLPNEGETGIYLAKNYKESGVMVGDRGYLSYTSSTASALQEQRLPIVVAGFYDPGILSIGNRCIFAPPFVTELLNKSASSFHLDKRESNGILVWLNDLSHVRELKAEIEKRFAEKGIDAMWKVVTFHDYSFAKDLLLQFQSDKYLFSLITAIILLVACCNIISLLTLLVSDKKREIGILQAMGASPLSIALIFGLCGIVLGVVSSLIGGLCASWTLKHIDQIVTLLSLIQGREAFNAAFFGTSLPSQLSASALQFIFCVTPLLSLLAGLIPAIKACRLKPAEILRSQ